MMTGGTGAARSSRVRGRECPPSSRRTSRRKTRVGARRVVIGYVSLAVVSANQRTVIGQATLSDACVTLRCV